MNEILRQVENIGIAPVVVLKNVIDCEPLANALLEGGLPCAEITFRTDVAEECIKIIAKKYPQILLGAGTVLTVDQADRAIGAGAKMIVTPGFNPKVVEHCLKHNYPICPGVMTPTEVDMAESFGLEYVKFFPAVQAGGVAMINAIGAPYPNVMFMPTGGINASNVGEYLQCGRVFACGGSWMVKSDLIESGNFDKITELTKEAVNIIKKVRG